MNNDRLVMSVKELNSYINRLISGDENLNYIYIKGEISNFKNHIQSGHFYMTLKDGESALKAVMFKSYASGVGFPLKDGMKVTALGNVRVFERDGIYQLYIEKIVPDGLGDLYQAFEELKRKLFAEGLFDDERKKPLPKYPETIGVVTSETGAAIHDILNILGRRFPAAKVVVYPALVQGMEAPKSIIKAIDYFNKNVEADVLIVGRGGGSYEDLFCFNDEALVRAAAASGIPVISAVGHESDFTLMDYAADVRAATPSAAAELATPDIGELSERLKNLPARLTGIVRSLVCEKSETLADEAEKARIAMKNLLERKLEEIDSGQQKLSEAFKARTERTLSEFRIRETRLKALSPEGVLKRGYSIASGPDGRVIRSVKQMTAGMEFSLKLADGRADAVVKTAGEPES